MKKSDIILTALAIGSAILHIRAEYYGPAIQIYIFKPLTMVFILIIALTRAKENLSFYSYAIIAGLVCSISGDVFLMLPSDRFVAGLVGFLIAHLFYIAAFTYGRPLRFTLWPPALFGLYGVVIYSILYPHLGDMKIPVLVYVLVIMVMGWRAWDKWNQARMKPALLAFLGAMLFIVSDSVLALNKFRGHFEIARALTLTTYFSAQWLIALSVSVTRARDRKDSSLQG
ncbi:MAG: lysoplasmalogenase [Deltaproteobacteria bacterium]|nr:lysoplasmalogenase [Deltaproteobacteria bacterium]